MASVMTGTEGRRAKILWDYWELRRIHPELPAQLRDFQVKKMNRTPLQSTFSNLFRWIYCAAPWIKLPPATLWWHCPLVMGRAYRCSCWAFLCPKVCLTSSFQKNTWKHIMQNDLIDTKRPKIEGYSHFQHIVIFYAQIWALLAICKCEK